MTLDLLKIQELGWHKCVVTAWSEYVMVVVDFFPPDISEIGRSAKSYCEHTARTQPTLSDIVVTLVEMGE